MALTTHNHNGARLLLSLSFELPQTQVKMRHGTTRLAYRLGERKETCVNEFLPLQLLTADSATFTPLSFPN